MRTFGWPEGETVASVNDARAEVEFESELVEACFELICDSICESRSGLHGALEQ